MDQIRGNIIFSETFILCTLSKRQMFVFMQLFPGGISYKESDRVGSPRRGRHRKHSSGSALEPKLYQLRQKKAGRPH